jgi:lipopolysaccharide heptosyltransferase II
MIGVHPLITDRHVHIINTHGLGDVILTFPLIYQILSYNPKLLSLTVKGTLEVEIIQLFFATKNIQFIQMANHENEQNALLKLRSYILRLRKIEPDIIFSCYGVHIQKANIVSLLSGAKTRIGWKGFLSFLNNFNISELSRKHKVYQHLALLNELLAKTHEAIFPIYKANKQLWRAVTEKLQNLNIDPEKDLLISLSPGSGLVEAHKRWPLGKFAELIDDFTYPSSVKFIFLGGPSEIELGKEILSQIKSKNRIVNMIGKCTVSETAEILHQSTVTVCNCNGLSHVAGAVGTPVVGLYGPTDPFKTGVFSSKASIISRKKECSPCYRRGYIKGCGEPVCMTEITVHSVAQEINKWLDMEQKCI